MFFVLSSRMRSLLSTDHVSLSKHLTSSKAGGSAAPNSARSARDASPASKVGGYRAEAPSSSRLPYDAQQIKIQRNDLSPVSQFRQEHQQQLLLRNQSKQQQQQQRTDEFMLTINTTGYSKPVAKKASFNNYMSAAKTCQEVTIPIHVAGESNDDSIYLGSGVYSSHAGGGRDYERFKPISCTIKTSNHAGSAASYASSSTCSLSIPSSTRAIATAATLAATKDELSAAYRPVHHTDYHHHPGSAKKVSYNQTQVASAVSYNNNAAATTAMATAASTSSAPNGGFYTTTTTTATTSSAGPRLGSLPITTPSTKTSSKLDISFTIEPAAYSASSAATVFTHQNTHGCGFNGGGVGTSSTRIRLEYSDNDDEYEHIIDDDDDDYKIY